MRKNELIGADGRPYRSATRRLQALCRCMPDRYREWKADPEAFSSGRRAVH